MKIALYIEDGLEQIVLTPEGDTERAILAKLHDGERQLSIHEGSFYDCKGGWVRGLSSYPYRQLATEDNPYGRCHRDDHSTILVLKPAPVQEDEIKQ